MSPAGALLRRIVLGAAVAGAVLATPRARADAPLWELGAGVAALRLPHYRGADQARNWLLPIPYLVYRGRILRADREGARAMLVERERFDVDLSVAAGAPADSRANDARRGMPDLDPTVEAGPSANLTLARGADWTLAVGLPLRAVFALGSSLRQIGWIASPNIDLDLRWQGWNLGVQLAALAGDRRLHETYYGVAPAYATATRRAYRARGGRAGWQGTLGATRRDGALWYGAFVRADRLDGAVFEASPLVRRRHGLSFGVGVSWVFATSGERVSEAR